jgi:hypothetical protein
MPDHASFFWFVFLAKTLWDRVGHLTEVEGKASEDEALPMTLLDD